MTGPRNRKAFRRSLERREQIRRVWERLRNESPYDFPTAVRILELLDFRISPRRVREHLAALRAEHDRQRVTDGGPLMRHAAQTADAVPE